MFFCDRYKSSKHTATLGLLVSHRLGGGGEEEGIGISTLILDC
jgi:hypothetical protein